MLCKGPERGNPEGQGKGELAELDNVPPPPYFIPAFLFVIPQPPFVIPAKTGT